MIPIGTETTISWGIPVSRYSAILTGEAVDREPMSIAGEKLFCYRRFADVMRGMRIVSFTELRNISSSVYSEKQRDRSLKERSLCYWPIFLCIHGQDISFSFFSCK